MSDTIFGAEVPALNNLTDGASYCLATNFIPAVSGTITHAKYFFPDSAGAGYTGGIYRVSTSVQQGTTVTFPDTNPGWRTAAFSPPIPVTAGVEYQISIYIPDRYEATTGYGWPKVSGNLTASADNGWLAITPSSNTFATIESGNGASYFADVVFEPSAGTTPFTKDTTERYRVLNAFTKNQPEAYRVLNSWTKNTADSYRVLNAFTKNQGDTYRVLNGLTKDTQERYRVLNGFTKDAQDRYRVLNGWTKDQAEAYRVFSTFSKDVTDTWTVLSTTGFVKDVADHWRVFNPFATEAVERYRVLNPWSVQQDDVWRVLNAWLVVKADSWRVYATFTRDVTDRYRVYSDTIPPPLPAGAIAFLEDSARSVLTAETVLARLE